MEHRGSTENGGRGRELKEEQKNTERERELEGERRTAAEGRGGLVASIRRRLGRRPPARRPSFAPWLPKRQASAITAAPRLEARRRCLYASARNDPPPATQRLQPSHRTSPLLRAPEVAIPPLLVPLRICSARDSQ